MPLEFVMFVGTNGHPFCLFDEIVAGFSVIYLELVDAFLLGSLDSRIGTWNYAR